MTVSAQWASIQPQGMKKKKKLYSQIIEEQAAQGIATQGVLAQKEQQQYDEQFALQEEQFVEQQRQNEIAQQQWQKDYDAHQKQWQESYDQRVAEIEAANQQWQQSFAQQKKQNLYGNVIGGLSTAASLLSAFDFF